MPFIFESTECLEWEENYFWTPRQIEKESKSSDNKPEYEMLPCRGEYLLKCKYYYKHSFKISLILE
jgi:hypothetical protein